MKKFKKLFSVILVSMMAVVILVSCGMKATPEESAKIYLAAMLKEDKTNIDKIGMKDDDFNKLKKSIEDDLIKDFQSSGLDSSLVTDEVKNNFTDDVIKGISKVEYEVTPDSTDKDSAKVNVKIKVFDMDKITKDVQDNLKTEYLANQSMSQQDLFKDTFKMFGQELADGTFEADTQTVSVTLNKKDNTWQVDDNTRNTILNKVFGK